MYLNKKQERALQLALEAMENYEFSSYDAECNEAINIIVDMLHNSQEEKIKRMNKVLFQKRQKVLQENFLKSIGTNFMDYQVNYITKKLMENT